MIITIQLRQLPRINHTGFCPLPIIIKWWQQYWFPSIHLQSRNFNRKVQLHFHANNRAQTKIKKWKSAMKPVFAELTISISPNLFRQKITTRREKVRLDWNQWIRFSMNCSVGYFQRYWTFCDLPLWLKKNACNLERSRSKYSTVGDS